jgi:ABC-type Fe3+ transport system substrate-binding protein
MKRKGDEMRGLITDLSKCLCAAVLAVLMAPTPAATAQSADWQKTWEEIKAAGKAEGEIVFRTGSSETKQYRQWLPELEKTVGLKIKLLAGSSSSMAAKIVAEQRAGTYSVDLWIGGPSSIVNVFVPAGAVQDLKPFLVHPEVTNPNLWFGGDLPWASEWTLAYAVSGPYNGMLVYNPKQVKPDEFTSYWDILNSKWKGKITMRDPRGDGVQSPRTFFYTQLGKDFYLRLFDEMKPVLASDARTAAEWTARGRYSLCLMGCNRAGEKAAADGLSIVATFPKILKEGFPVDMGGNGMTVMNNLPHPAATKYFINWFLSREGQIYYQKITENFSLRKDIPRDGVAAENMLRTDDEQYHWYGWKYPVPRDESQDWLRDVMKTKGFE